MNRTALRSLFLALWVMAGSACAVPAAVEGIFADKPFALFDEKPDGKAEGETELLLVLMEMKDERMSAVSVHLPGLDSLPVGEEIEVGTGDWGDHRPSFDVVEGELVREMRADGVEILSTGDDALHASSVEGSLTLAERDDVLVGHFQCDLDDGGHLDGTFQHPR